MNEDEMIKREYDRLMDEYFYFDGNESESYWKEASHACEILAKVIVKHKIKRGEYNGVKHT